LTSPLLSSTVIPDVDDSSDTSQTHESPRSDPESIPSSLLIRGKVTGVRLKGLVLSEGFPHWLLALRPVDWSSICWMQFGSYDPSLDLLLDVFLLRLKGILRPVPFDVSQVSSLLADVDLVLVSGSDLLMQRVLPLIKHTPVLLLPGHPQNRHVSSTMTRFGVSVSKIKHFLVGGVTNGSVFMGLMNTSLVGFKSPLRRHLRHVLEFSERPRACLPDPSFDHYLGGSTLRLDALTLPVVYKSPHFCTTGWGVRDLNLKELACSFDLPSPSHATVTEAALLLPLYPLKLMEAPLQHILTLLSGPVTAAPVATPLVEDLSSSVSPGQTWLPTLGKFLPDTWLDETIISDKAAKADDALQVPEHLWDNRSTLVLPQLTKASLAGFRKLP
jgi:hypothetical protein